MNSWVTELKNYLPAEIPILIAGNKCDLRTKVITEEMAA
jgi:GTPase SAR1 family protein